MNLRIWRCGGFALDLSTPLVMGIVNVTPDSFSDGGSYGDSDEAVQAGLAQFSAGAAIVDVGGESTRPGAEQTGVAVETERVVPVVEGLACSGGPVSVDTRHAPVAAAAIRAGAVIVNDVSGFSDPSMVELVASEDVGVVVMHMLGDPVTMQSDPRYHDVVAEVREYLLSRAAALEAAGVARERIVLDPGIGFGKTLEHNLQLIRGIDALAKGGYPVLMGMSRKRFIGDITGEPEPRRRMGGSLAAALEAARRGASVLRVHDVAETVQALAVSSAVLLAPTGNTPQ